MDKRWLTKSLGAFSIGLGATQAVAPGRVLGLVGARDDDRARRLVRLIGTRELVLGTALGARRNGAPWLWLRLAGDIVDLRLADAVRRGVKSPDGRRRASITMAALAGVALADLAAAVVTTRGRRGRPIHANGRITVNRPVGEVYGAWRNLENLPQFMAHLETVRHLGDGRSRWRAAGPAGIEVEWDAEIDSEHIDEHISWRSVGETQVRHSGRVDFRPAPGGRGTEVRVHLIYEPPGGRLGARIAKLFGEAPDQQLRDDLRRFKQVLETGEVVRSESGPDGARTRTHLTE
ncbi:SRPBCC family protein, partial [Amycolatopsis rhizosphaerae]